MAGLGSLSSQISQQLGSFSLPGALGSSMQADGSKTTTAVNIAIVINGVVQGLIRSLRFEESFDQHPVKVVGGAVAAAIIPGVYTGSASVSKVFLFGVDLNTAFGGNVRPISGKSQTTQDFTKLYFNIVVLDNQGNPLQIFHDCALNSVSTSVEIDGVIIMEEASVVIRWSEKD
jgi:hypothetical protein